MSQSEVTIKIDKTSGGRPVDLPFLLSFPQKIPTEAAAIPVVIGQQRRGGSKAKQYMVAADVNGMTFKGHTQGDFSASNDCYKFAIGVLKEGSSELVLQLAEHAFVMKPHLVAKTAVARNASLSSLERRQSLTEEFGSRKKKRALSAAQSNIISSENIAGAGAVESTMAAHFDASDGIEVPSLDAADEALQAHRNLMLPSYNAETDVLEDAYPILELLPRDLNDDIDDVIENLLSASDSDALTQQISTLLAAQSAGELVQSLFQRIALLSTASSASSAKKDKKKKTRLRFARLLFLHYLIKFYVTISSRHDSSIKKEDLYNAMTGTPESVVKFACNKFTAYRSVQGKPTFSLTKTSMNKFLLHIVAVALHLSEFSVDMTLLGNDIKMTAAMLCNLSKELGCKILRETALNVVTNEDQVKFKAQLVVPLDFPKRKMIRK